MSPRVRFVAIFSLGLAAAVGAGYAALEPLRAADAAALELWGEIGSLRDGVAALEPGDEGDPQAGRAGRAELLGRLDQAESEFTVRREAIVRLAVFHLAFSLAAATGAFWAAVTLASRSARARALAAAERAASAAAIGTPLDSLRGEYIRSFVADSEGRLRTVSAAVARDLGRPRESLIGEPVTALFTPAARETIESILVGIGPDRPSAQIDLQFGEGAAERRLRLRLHAHFDESGRVDAIVGEGRDLPAENPAAAGGAEGSASAGASGELAASPAKKRARTTPSRRGRAAAAAPPPPPRVDTSRLAGAEVLVALHNPDERRLVAFLLAQVGVRITAVSDGEALFSALEGVRAEPFDAVLIEPHLPGVEGLAALRRLRERGFAIPVVALVPSGDPHLAAACRDSGCAKVASTPVDRRALVAALAEALPELDPTR